MVCVFAPWSRAAYSGAAAAAQQQGAGAGLARAGLGGELGRVPRRAGAGGEGAAGG